MDAPPTAKRISACERRDGDGNPVRNRILLSLPAKEFDSLAPQLEFVRLQHLQILHEVGQSLKSVYFCNSGMFSSLIVTPEGRSLEVRPIGIEGFAGVPLIAGFRTSNTRTVVHVGATAFRLDAGVFRAKLPELPSLEQGVKQYSQWAAMCVTSIAACNGLHEIEQRLTRWLLMCQDRLGIDSLPLTQDFLAQVLGARRASVTVAAGILSRTGLIKYKRGEVTILDRQRLEDACCFCYEQLLRQTQEWESQVPRSNVGYRTAAGKATYRQNLSRTTTIARCFPLPKQRLRLPGERRQRSH